MSQEPRDLIIEKLCAPPGRRTVMRTYLGGVQGVRVEGGPYVSAQRESVRFIKERRSATRQLHAVVFMDTDGLEHLELVGVTRDDSGSWVSNGGAGGGRSGPARDRPWVNFCGWSGRGVFCAGGEVIGDGADAAARVRLTLSDSGVVEDVVEEGIVLFLVEREVELRATAEIFDGEGRLLATHSALGTGRCS